MDVREPTGFKTVERRFFSGACYDNIARALVNVNWSAMYRTDNCQEQANFLYSTLHDVINQFAPVCQFRLKNNDKPWVTKLFKDSVDEQSFCIW